MDLFSRLATALAVVLTALEHKHSHLPNAVETLDAAVAALVQIRIRGDATDVWALTEAEFPVVLDGIFMVEQCIGTLDVALLERTAANLSHVTN